MRILEKVRAILFLWKASWHCTWRIVQGYTWNSIMVNLEYSKGQRKILTYIRLSDKTVLRETP